MKKNTSILHLVIIPIVLFLVTINTQSVKAQSSTFEPKDPKLYKTIFHMDSVMFNAFNTQNLEVLKTSFADNVEFYHDNGGLSNYEATMDAFKKLFGTNPGLKRELVQGTLEVYPIPDYGAVEIGLHRFIHTENGKEVIGTFKFVHTWQYKDGQWKVTRVVSVGH